MTNETMIMNQITINTFDFSTLSREQLEGLFTNFVGAKLVLTDCNGIETSFSVMEVLERETQYCDEDGIEIFEETVAY